MSPPTSSGSTTKCGLFEIIVFIAAIVFGTMCSICSKTMMSLTAIGIDGNEQVFGKPIFQTFGMFVGMTFGLVMHYTVLVFHIPFPGYDHSKPITNGSSTTTATLPTTIAEGKATVPTETDPLLLSSTVTNKKSTTTTNGNNTTTTPIWMYFFLIVPSIFDLGATALCMMGLRYLDTSIYQLLRGSGIIFVALMKQHVLGDVLYTFQWYGVVWNVISVVLVGYTAVLNTTTDTTANPQEAFLGVVLVMSGAFVQALQFVFEEKVMTMDDAAVPPLLLIGMEGLWGTILCLVVVYPIAFIIPGDDYGSYEDPYNTFEMLMNSTKIQLAFVIYFFTIFGYNVFAVLVTYTLNSIWHAILDNFRPITVWGTNMLIFYVITSSGDFGEPWTKYSYIQLIGMFVLLYGTAVYNAPNAGSIKLNGEWYSLFVNCSAEYNKIEKEELEKQLDIEWEQKQVSFQTKRFSSMAEVRSPHFSIHTQALGGGLGAPHM